MAKEYQWRTSTNFSSEASLSHGVDPSTYQNWQRTSVLSNNVECSYWFRDGNAAPYIDANSSRIVFKIIDNWTVSFDYKNNMTVKLTTTLQSVVRDDVRGAVPNTPGRHIVVSQSNGGAQVWSTDDLQVGTAHTLLDSPIRIDQRTVVLPPGQQASFSSLFIRNETIGLSSWDEVYAGVEFQNILPRDYRPGAVLKGAEEWMPTTGDYISHNRLNGACHVRTNNGWQECRTTGGFDGEKGNPPLILTAGNADSWRDQKLIGKEK